jgi:hypothetical protein
VRPATTVAKRIWRPGHNGVPYRRTLWEGVLVDAGGVVWRCGHTHDMRIDADGCAKDRLLRRQRRRTNGKRRAVRQAA